MRKSILLILELILIIFFIMIDYFPLSNSTQIFVKVIIFIMGIFILENLLKSENIEPKNKILLAHRYYNYLMFLFLVTTSIFFIFIVFIVINYIDSIINIFIFFEKAKLINQFLIIKMQTSESGEIIALSLAFFTYLYFFEYVKRKGVMIFIAEDKESKYFSFLLSFSAIFNFIILFPLIFYLFFIKKSILEALIILISYLIIKFTLFPLLETHKKIIFDYDCLSRLNPLLVKKDLDTIAKELKFGDIFSKIKERESHSMSLKIFRTYGEPLIRGIILYILFNSSLILKSIFTLTIMTAIFGLILQYNILSIIYVELILLVCYFIMSSISFIPIKTVKLSLENGKHLENVYIIEDSPKGFFIVLTEKNSKITIMKNSVRCIE